jgi:hypothetical protein
VVLESGALEDDVLDEGVDYFCGYFIFGEGEAQDGEDDLEEFSEVFEAHHDVVGLHHGCELLHALAHDELPVEAVLFQVVFPEEEFVDAAAAVQQFLVLLDRHAFQSIS